MSSSVMDRLRSPGTVRKLSLKMKKLPELRRKLSLRSSSHASRQEEVSGKTSGSSSSQNIISRYHLDSSAPPSRLTRRSYRGSSASKAGRRSSRSAFPDADRLQESTHGCFSSPGYFSDGDSPELLPRQQLPPAPTTQETCDVSSFQLYVGSETQRCSQRVTGLFTVHLLGLEEMKSGRLEDSEKQASRQKQTGSQAPSHLSLRSEDSKEVFLAIQVDGVTRARTALLTLRGSTLPLNHTFHLELERARLLRLLVLTPGEQVLPTPHIVSSSTMKQHVSNINSTQSDGGSAPRGSRCDQEQGVLSGPGLHPPAV